MAVQNRHQRLQPAGAETGLESLDSLRGQRNLRHEHDCALSPLERVGNALQIDFRLATASHAVEKKCGGR